MQTPMSPTDRLAPTRDRLEQAFEEIVFDMLKPGAVGLGSLYVVFAVAHRFSLPAPANSVMPVVAFASALLLFGLAHLLDRGALAKRYGHRIAAGLAALVLTNSLLHLVLVNEPRSTTNLMLLMIGAGCVLLSTRWLALIVGVTLTSWILACVYLGQPLFIDFGLLSAFVLSFLVHAGRVQTYTRMEALHLRDEQRRQELESALASAEREIHERKRVEADLERARAELEVRVQERTAELASINETLRREIGVRELIEAALRKSETHLVLAQKVGGVGSWDLDLLTGQLNWSAEMVRIFGYEPGRFVPNRDAMIAAIHPLDRTQVKETLNSALQSASHYNIEYRIIRPDGSERLVSEQAEFVVDEDRHPIKLIGTVQDVTERKQLETQLRHSQKMEAIGQLAAGVAHDFNNILSVIRGNSSLLLDICRAEPESFELLKQISHAADRAISLTRQLLLFSNKEIMQPRVVDLNEITGNLAKMLGRILGEDIHLDYQPGSNLLPIEADPGMIEQVIMNLAVNARDAMPRGGRLSIVTAQITVTELQAFRNPEMRAGEFICLSVSDTGCGIEPRVLSRIFEPFFTTKPVGKGTGLGLSTAYGIVKQHKGWIKVASRKNEGTRFDIYLPAVHRPVVSLPESTVNAALRSGTECILLVEDETPLRQVVTRVLRQHGYRVCEADCGPSAIQIWQQQKEQIDLLLTDLVMPEGITGWDLAERCLAEKPGLKVIFTSGYSGDFFNIKEVLGQGIFFLPKPYHWSTLSQMLRDCFDPPEGGRGKS
ncbi:MAG: ATP-binding protein [Verrucomicrobiota bacterium]